MAILKDIFDILNQNRQVNQAIKTFLNELFAKKQKRTPQEEIADYKALLQRVSDENFEQEFTNKLDYYAVLLGLIVKTCIIKDNGIFIRNFYHPDFHLYFPPLDEEPELYKSENEKHKEKEWVFVKKERVKYRFYLFPSDLSDEYLKSLKKHIEERFEVGERQEAVFLKRLGDKQMTCYGVSSIADNDGNYRFSVAGFQEDILLRRLNKAKSGDIRSGILEDIHQLLDY